MKKFDLLLNIISISYALTTIENILSIILLAINVFWICYNFGLKIYKKVKNNEEITAEDLTEITKDITEIKNSIEEVNKNDTK